MRLIAALGRLVLTAREIDPNWLGLLLKLSDPDTRLWVQKAAADRRPSIEISLDEHERQATSRSKREGAPATAGDWACACRCSVAA